MLFYSSMLSFWWPGTSSFQYELISRTAASDRGSEREWVQVCSRNKKETYVNFWGKKLWLWYLLVLIYFQCLIYFTIFGIGSLRYICKSSYLRVIRQQMILIGSPGGDSGKEPACQCRRLKRCRFDPWVGKIP